MNIAQASRELFNDLEINNHHLHAVLVHSVTLLRKQAEDPTDQQTLDELLGTIVALAHQVEPDGAAVARKLRALADLADVL